MVATVFKFFSKILNPVWLTGPIFGKELRVSSRRKRNYTLRIIYLAFLMLFIILVWSSMVRFRPGSGAYQISRMSEAGLAIISTIVWFQFIATQLIAIVMLSTSISNEIYNQTLGVLATTPINSFQIVMGKLFSKLLQLILLLSITLPLLAIIRVFGGVPWDFVLSSFCITLTAIIFAGSLSMYFSISGRRAYEVILKTFFVLGILYLFVPAMISLVFASFNNRGSPTTLYSLFTYTNPFLAMQFNTMSMLSARMPRGMGFLSWPSHCATMLGVSVLILTRAVIIVRRVLLRQITGQLSTTSKGRIKVNKKKLSSDSLLSKASLRQIRTIKGSPMVWKELRTPLIQGSRKKSINC